MYDLILRNGRLFDPALGIDRTGSIAFSGGRIAALDLAPDAASLMNVDVAGDLITPGLIDMHVHVYDGGTSLGVSPEAAAHTSAATTLVDAGSAGAGNFRGFREHVIAGSSSRVLAYLNISFAGIFGFGKSFAVGEGQDDRLLRSDECRAAIEANRDIIVGIKARVGPTSSGGSGLQPLKVALALGEEMGLAVMVHIEKAPPTVEEVVSLLRPGDVLTHCCRPLPNAIADQRGHILPVCLQARERGVYFDTGHGRGSFSFASFHRMRDSGFLPDVVSSDIHAFNLDRGVDLMTTMSKLVALGVPLGAVVRMATTNAAKALRRGDLGRLENGASGDVSVISILEGATQFTDTVGETITAGSRLKPRGAVRSGNWTSLGDH